MHVMPGDIDERFLHGDDAVDKILNQIQAVFGRCSKWQFSNLTIYSVIAFRSMIKFSLIDGSAPYIEKIEENARGIGRISENWH